MIFDRGKIRVDNGVEYIMECTTLEKVEWFLP